MSRRITRSLFVLLVLLLPALASGQTRIAANLQKRVNGILSLMCYSVVPDMTTSSLSIDDGTSGNPGLTMSQLSGGVTMSNSFPLYLEGGFAYSRYDPTFVATTGQEDRALPLKWNTVSITGGIGWDFPLTQDGELKLRPIFNFAYGHLESDASLGVLLVESRTNRDLDFLRHGQLNAVGTGGSLVLDYEHYRPEHEIDVELRYTDINLSSTGGTSPAVKGHATGQTVGLWSRWRAPTGLVALDRPVRYVLEFSQSAFLGSQANLLGFNYLTQVGAGLELDSSAHHIIIERTRLLVRYVFGHNVSGVSLGLAVTF